MLKKTLAWSLAVAVLVLSGCNTIHGVGQDLEAAGEGIQDATNP